MRSVSTVERNADRSLPGAKLTGLELLRFASALAVLIWHYQHFWYVADMPVDFIREKQPLYGLLWPLYNYGVYGVQVFWIISGYIFFWKYAAGIADGRVSGWKFLVLRFSRLYPLHLVTLVAVVVLQWKFQALSGQPFVYPNNDGFHLMLQLGLASNWGWEVGPSFNGPIWSISLEVVVYGLFFGVMRLVGSGRWVAPGMLLLGALGYLLKIPSQIFQCVFCFFLGGFVAQTGGGWPRKQGVDWLLRLLLLSAPLVFFGYGWQTSKPLLHLFVVGYSATLIHWLAEYCSLPRASQYWVELAGNLTYSSYLLHFPVQLSLMLLSAQIGRSLPKDSPAFLAAYLAVTFLLALWVYDRFEMPMQARIRGWFAPQRA